MNTVRRVIGATVATVSLAGGCAHTPEIHKIEKAPSSTVYESNIQQSPTTFPEAVAPPTTIDPVMHKLDLSKGCVDPTDQDIAEVKQMFAAPTAPEARQPDNFAWRQQVAQNLGLHIINPDDYDPRVNKNSDAELEHIPFIRFYELAAKFFREYNINLDIAQGEMQLGAGAPTPEDLEAVNAKRTLVNLERSLTDLPTEVIQSLGFRRLTLARFAPGFAGYTLYDPVKGTIQGEVIEINKAEIAGVDPEITAKKTREDNLHEIEHMWDLTYFCGVGEAKVDPAFDALNPTHPTYPEQFAKAGMLFTLPLPTGQMSMEDFWDRNSDPKYAKDVIAMRKYSFSGKDGLFEDKGTLGPVIFNRNELAHMLNHGEQFPVLQDKIALMAGREKLVAEKFIKYMAATSVHDN